MLDEQDAEQIATIIEAHMHQRVEERRITYRTHWPRRVLILGGVLAVGVVLHKIIEDMEARSALQSTELALAALLDSVFSKVREIT